MEILVDEQINPCYNSFRWLLTHGEMAERLKALVLKTSDAAMYRGFESLSLRHILSRNLAMEKYPSGRRGSPAKGVGRVTGARVQLPPSPPNEKSAASGLILLEWKGVEPKVGLER